MKKDLFYALTCLCFTIMIGGAVYEHLNVVPQWSAAPPHSLAMFQGEYGLKPETFWMVIHPVNFVLFIITLVLHWKTARRKTVAGVLLLYTAIIVITAIYFVPELISIISTPFSTTADAGLTQRASRWETLSLVRLGVLLVMAVVLFLGLTKEAHRLSPATGSVKRKEAVPDYAM
jgi:cytochrome bd-type quinol oxidase subunit 2